VHEEEPSHCDGHGGGDHEGHHLGSLVLHLEELLLEGRYRVVVHDGESHLESRDKHPKAEIPKEFMIFQTHTVAYPRTMVIHAHYAAFADRAVVGAWGLNVFALVTVLELAEFFQGGGLNVLELSQSPVVETSGATSVPPDLHSSNFLAGLLEILHLGRALREYYHLHHPRIRQQWNRVGIHILLFSGRCLFMDHHQRGFWQGRADPGFCLRILRHLKGLHLYSIAIGINKSWVC